MQAADFGKLHDPACREDLDRPEIGRVLVQREMGPRLMVIDEIASQDAGSETSARSERAWADAWA